jgi:hypothetical protein
MRNLYNQNLARRAKCCARKVWIKILWPVFVGSLGVLSAFLFNIAVPDSIDTTPMLFMEDPDREKEWIGYTPPAQSLDPYKDWVIEEDSDLVPPTVLWVYEGTGYDDPDQYYYQIPEPKVEASASKLIISASLAAISGALLLYQVVRNRCECGDEKCK